METTWKRNDYLRAYEIVCPNCNALPGKKCTTPTDNGRKEVNWIHYSRIPEK